MTASLRSIESRQAEELIGKMLRRSVNALQHYTVQAHRRKMDVGNIETSRCVPEPPQWARLPLGNETTPPVKGPNGSREGTRLCLGRCIVPPFYSIWLKPRELECLEQCEGFMPSIWTQAPNRRTLCRTRHKDQVGSFNCFRRNLSRHMRSHEPLSAPRYDVPGYHGADIGTDLPDAGAAHPYLVPGLKARECLTEVICHQRRTADIRMTDRQYIRKTICHAGLRPSSTTSPTYCRNSLLTANIDQPGGNCNDAP